MVCNVHGYKIEIDDERIRMWKKKYVDFTQYDANILIMNAYNGHELSRILKRNPPKLISEKVNRFMERECG